MGKYVYFLSRGEGHGDTVLVAGHEVSVTEVAAGVCRPLVLRAVEAVPVFSLTPTTILMRGERRSHMQFLRFCIFIPRRTNGNKRTKIHFILSDRIGITASRRMIDI